MSKMKTRKRLITIPRLIILALIFTLLLMGLWVFIRGQLISGFATGVHNMESEGYQVAHEGLTVKGFPFLVKAETKSLSIAAPGGDAMDPSKNWSVKTKSLQLSSPTLTPLSWQIEHNETMRIDMRGATGERYMFDVIPADFVASAGVDLKGHLKAVHLDLASARLEPLVGASPMIRSVGKLDGDLKVTGGTGKFEIMMKDIVLDESVPLQIRSVLGTKLETLQIKGSIDNIQSFLDGELGDWQASGAVVNIDTVDIKWGALDLIGMLDFTVLNDKLQGTITLKPANIDTLFKQVKAANLISKDEASFARMAIATMPKNEEGRVELVFPIKDNQLLFFGQVIADFNP